jgi:hypothetical protein
MDELEQAGFPLADAKSLRHSGGDELEIAGCAVSPGG